MPSPLRADLGALFVYDGIIASLFAVSKFVTAGHAVTERIGRKPEPVAGERSTTQWIIRPPRLIPAGNLLLLLMRGRVLLAVYVLMGLAFFFVTPPV